MTDSNAESRRRQLTLVVLGHVDHGKTALVRALTGIETDRLAEERERGLSIVPGYAWFETEGTCVDLIDAPGHQVFIRAMIGAASGIDAALLVVAANEGIMPQTREHVAIADLLGLGGGIVVLSKCDLLSAAEISERRAQLSEYLAETFLRDAEIVATAAIKDEGIPALRGALVQLESQHAVDPAIPFYMPVDRSFTKSGFGRIATGTVHAGRVTTGDSLFLTPGGSQVSVRGIQVHGQSVEQAGQGDRAALNVRGAGVDEISRGMVLGHEYAVLEGQRLDVQIEPVAEFAVAIKNGAVLRVLTGTSEAQVKLRVLEHDTASKDLVLAQLRCDRALPVRRGTRFVLRSNSPAETVGGGVILDALAPRRRRFDTKHNSELATLAGADHHALLRHFVRSAGAAGIEKRELSRRLGIGADALADLIDRSGGIEFSTSRVCDVEMIDAVAAEIEAALRAYHEQFAQHAGMKHADIPGALSGGAHEALVQAACDRLKAAGRISSSGDRWHMSDFDAMAGLSDAQRRLIERIEKVFANSGVESPSIDEIIGKNAGARESLRYLLDRGRVVRLQTRGRSMLALHASALESVREQIAARFPYPDEFAVKDVRDLLGTTRKHVVPLLEHLDATGFTLRKGDMRRIRQ